MEKYSKGSLDIFSLYVQNEISGVIIPGTCNLFGKKSKLKQDQKDLEDT